MPIATKLLDLSICLSTYISVRKEDHQGIETGHKRGGIDKWNITNE